METVQHGLVESKPKTWCFGSKLYSVEAQGIMHFAMDGESRLRLDLVTTHF